MIFIYLSSGYKTGKTGARADGLAVSSGVRPVLPTHCSHLWSLVSGTGRFIARTSRHRQVVMMSVCSGCDASVPFTRFQTPGWQIPSSTPTSVFPWNAPTFTGRNLTISSHVILAAEKAWERICSTFKTPWCCFDIYIYIFFPRVLFLSRIYPCLAHRDLNHDCCLKVSF